MQRARNTQTRRESQIESTAFVALLTADVVYILVFQVQVVLSMLERQGLTLDRWQGLQNVQAACVVYIAVFQAQTMQESQMLTTALKEKEEEQQKMLTWTMTLRGRQVAELQVMLQMAELQVMLQVAEQVVVLGLNCGL